jgi:hypothetical protein
MVHADGELLGERRDAVVAHLAESRAAQQKLRAMEIVSSVVRDRAGASGAKADGIADLVMKAIEAERAGGAELPRDEVAPTNVLPFRPRRLLFAGAAVVIAAAAAVMIWIGTPPRPERLARLDVVSASPSASLGAGHVASSAPELAVADDREHGVVVSAVDFGSRLGAIFYVPAESAGSATTTVVWLADDPSEGDE